MMFTNAKNIQPDLVGELDLFQKILHPLNRAETESGCRIRDDRPKAVDTDLHVWDSYRSLVSSVRYPRLCAARDPCVGEESIHGESSRPSDHQITYDGQHE